MRGATAVIAALPLLVSAAPTQKRWQGAEACSYIATQTRKLKALFPGMADTYLRLSISKRSARCRCVPQVFPVPRGYQAKRHGCRGERYQLLHLRNLGGQLARTVPGELRQS